MQKLRMPDVKLKMSLSDMFTSDIFYHGILLPLKFVIKPWKLLSKNNILIIKYRFQYENTNVTYLL